MKFISFNFSLKINFILKFLIIIQIIDIFLLKIIDKNERKKIKKKNINYNYFECYIITCFRNFSYCFGIIIYFLNKFISNKYYRESKIKNSTLIDRELRFSIRKIQHNYFSKNYIINSFILIIIFIISILLNIIKIKKIYSVYETSLTLSFLSFILVNKLFLSFKFEKHHILSIIVICMLNIPIIIYFSFDYIYENIYNFIYYIFTGIYLGYFEYLIEIKFYNPYFLFFFESCFYSLLNIINIILYFLYKNKYMKNDIFNFRFFQFNIFNLIYRLLLYIIIFYCSSIYIILIELFSRSLIYLSIYKPIKGDLTDDEILRIILSIFTFIFVLIYIEILEINCCNLNKNLKKNILNREKNEESNLKINNY